MVMFKYSSECLIKETADRMAADGFKEAGYKYVLLTDCYSASHRTPSDTLCIPVSV